jgi:deoxyribodipyrimidine photo-lyase
MVNALAPRYESALFWFRRDLRAEDNAGLRQALESARAVHCVFVFDSEILEKLEHRKTLGGPATHLRQDRRVEFIWHSVSALKRDLQALGGDLIVLHAAASEAIPQLGLRLQAQAVFTNHDYEPNAIVRDDRVRSTLGACGIEFHTFKDQCIFEKSEILTQAGKPYSVFTQYKNTWLARVQREHLQPHAIAPLRAHFAPARADEAEVASLAQLGFEPTNLLELKLTPGAQGARELFEDFKTRIAHYKTRRDFPGVKGVSYLSVHQRFGTISIRELARFAHAQRNEGADTWLSELIWRDFYFQILWHFPHVAEHAFKREYEALEFENRADFFDAWREARTGYPIIDAAMLQLAQTGYMHNRLRMIVASFLVKDLLIDWRWGERHFAEALNDFDLAANNGGWQWAASTGCDAQPYFRIFNPVTQSQRFDPEGRFIRRYLPRLANVSDAKLHEPWTMSAAEQSAAGVIIGRDYPAPIVEHAAQRAKALRMFAKAKKSD